LAFWKFLEAKTFWPPDFLEIRILEFALAAATASGPLQGMVWLALSDSFNNKKPIGFQLQAFPAAGSCLQETENRI